MNLIDNGLKERWKTNTSDGKSYIKSVYRKLGKYNIEIEPEFPF